MLVSSVKSLSVVIPVYNEEMAVREVLQDLLVMLDKESDLDYEVIAVNDGSTDNTSIELSKVEHVKLKVVDHDRNCGYGASLKTGVRRSKGDWICITDADGTYPNERIPDLLKMCGEYQMVVGARIAKDVQYSKVRKIPKYFLIRYASWITGRNIPDLNSGLRIFNRNVTNQFLSIFPDGFSFTTTITLAYMTNHYSVHFEPIGYSHRIGNSKIQPIRDTLRFVQLIMRTGMYFAPLRVFTPIIYIMFLMLGISLAYDFYITNLTDKTVMLFTSCLNTLMFALLADMFHRTKMLKE